MRLICSVFLLVLSISVFSQEEVFQQEVVKLEDELNSSDKLGLRISTCREIIEISFPDHLNFVLKYTKELMKLSEAANDMDSKAFAYFYMGEYWEGLMKLNQDEFLKCKGLGFYAGMDIFNIIPYKEILVLMT